MQIRNGKLKISSQISLSGLLEMGFLLSFLMVYVYARSITPVYIVLSLIIICFSYTRFIRNYYQIDAMSRVLVLILLAISIVNSILHGDVKSCVMLNTSLVLPYAVSTMRIKYVHIKRGIIVTSIAALICISLQVHTNVFGYINSNTLSFLAYMGISVAFLWFKSARNKLYPIVYLGIGYYYILNTGSRNVAIVILICFVLLLLPESLYEKQWFYRTVYISAILYTVLALDIMEAGFANSEIARVLDEYVASFSEKAWGMESRVDFLTMRQEQVENMSFLEKIFGTGIVVRHGHNLFYQSMFTYGYLGTAIVYFLYVLIFEMAYRLIKAENDGIVIGCVIIMIGHFWIQGADVYMIGNECCSIMPFVIMGIIMHQHRVKN